MSEFGKKWLKIPKNGIETHYSLINNSRIASIFHQLSIIIKSPARPDWIPILHFNHRSHLVRWFRRSPSAYQQRVVGFRSRSKSFAYCWLNLPLLHLVVQHRQIGLQPGRAGLKNNDSISYILTPKHYLFFTTNGDEK